MTETFADEVRRRRSELDLSQSQLGAIAGVSRGTIRNIEANLVEPNEATMRGINLALERAESGEPATLPAAVDPLREEIARQIEAMADAYPEDALDRDSDVIRGARHAYRMAARIARGEDR
ncbi:transcriptional regulator with XRE-family HTH domain [Lipingzhangella halophila]|uniref:Transcriptional regulator with XRE-family HTH domain n=1 Tax=Lipingzhangella halophila TaxID=1783352 RepID=A0A7W7RH42_9ACTN|nr:helix-turn-helix domain-containing protein [Lipingzhangella halophila]MBB4931790.1 transcriptional regulator with XRE-family HTH domain [Lipingzhangella halophila]